MDKHQLPGLVALRAAVDDAPPRTAAVLRRLAAVCEEHVTDPDIRRTAMRPADATRAAEGDADLIFAPPPCVEDIYRESFGPLWFYYWVAFGCWLG